MSRITFTYDRIEPSLYWGASKAACKTEQKNGAVPMIFIWIGFFIVALVFFWLVDRVEFIAQNSGAFFAGLVAMWLLLIGVAKTNQWRMARTLEDDQISRGPVEVDISEEGCRFTSSYGSSFLTWKGISDVVHLKDGIGLRSGLLVYPLAKKDFPTGRSEAEIIAQIEAWVASA